MIWAVGICLVLLFGGVVFFGAPYLPTLQPQVATALDLLELKPGQTMLELGCGDGRVLMAAAERGVRAIGIELNPLLALIAWLRTRRYRSLVRIKVGNFWQMRWPPSDGVFVFLLPRYMPRLDTMMQRYGGKLVSVAFAVSGKVPVKSERDVFCYKYPAMQ